MLNIDIVIRGEILSGTDRSRSLATGRFLTAPCHQQRLAAVWKAVRARPGYGQGVTEVINDIEYRSVFDPDWSVEVDALMVVGQRHRTQQLDIDSFWSDFQNAMAFPSPHLKVKKPADGQPLYTVVPDDSQFTRFSVTRVADPLATREGDMVIARFKVLPPPTLELALAH